MEKPGSKFDGPRDNRDSRDGGGMGGDEGFGGGREGRGDRDGGGREGRGGGRGFGRRKVDPFLVDKTLLLDYKNIKTIQRFVTETGRIVPRHITGVTAKNQRKLSQFIKRCRNLGLLAPKMEG